MLLLCSGLDHLSHLASSSSPTPWRSFFPACLPHPAKWGPEVPSAFLQSVPCSLPRLSSYTLHVYLCPPLYDSSAYPMFLRAGIIAFLMLSIPRGQSPTQRDRLSINACGMSEDTLQCTCCWWSQCLRKKMEFMSTAYQQIKNMYVIISAFLILEW